MEKRPNILIITSDQQRKDSLGIYNQNVHTPVLDAIASDGITMDRAYITHPTCTPSRASILTGQMASHHGAYTIGTALNEDTVKFSDLLSKEGYDTFFTGKPHFQQLSDPDSFEWSGNALNEEYWKGYQSGYYGFKDLKIYNGHTDYSFTAGMHYRLWLKEKGLSDEEISSRFNYIPSNTYREHGEWKIERKFHPTVFTADCAVDYLTRHKTENPFLMWVSFSDPHDPHVVPEPYASMYAPEDVNYLGYVEGEHNCRPVWYHQLYENGLEGLDFNDEFGAPSVLSAKKFGDEKYFREITAIHHGMVKLMDEEIGRIVQTLKAKGEYDNTLILFTTDHGDYLGNHGYVYKGFPAFEEVYNGPMIVKLPDSKHRGSRSSALTSHIDIAPTILEAAKAGACDEMDGISQWKLWNGETKQVREFAEIENRPVEKGFYQKMLVTSRYKIVVYMDSKDGELYDLETDVNQYHNLWDEDSCFEIKKELLQKMAKKSGYGIEEIDKLLAVLWKGMHDEEPVQARTCYS